MKKDIINCVLEQSFDWVNLLTAITSVANLGLIVWIFFKEVKNDNNKMLLEYNISWYRLIDIDERVRNIRKFVSQTIVDIENLNNNPEQELSVRKKISSDIILNFKENIEREKELISSIIKPLSNEENGKILKMLNDLFELQSNQIQESILQNSNLDSSSLVDQKDTIVNYYYEMGKKIIKGE